jgi:hypothetical protein
MLSTQIASFEHYHPESNSNIFRHQTIIVNGAFGLDGRRFRSIQHIFRLARHGNPPSNLAPAFSSGTQFGYVPYA